MDVFAVLAFGRNELLGAAVEVFGPADELAMVADVLPLRLGLRGLECPCKPTFWAGRIPGGPGGGAGRSARRVCGGSPSRAAA